VTKTTKTKTRKKPSFYDSAPTPPPMPVAKPKPKAAKRDLLGPTGLARALRSIAADVTNRGNTGKACLALCHALAKCSGDNAKISPHLSALAQVALDLGTSTHGAVNVCDRTIVAARATLNSIADDLL